MDCKITYTKTYNKKLSALAFECPECENNICSIVNKKNIIKCKYCKNKFQLRLITFKKEESNEKYRIAQYVKRKCRF